MFENFWWHALVLLMGSLAIYWIVTQKSKVFSTAVLVLGFSLFLAVLGYTRFGHMFDGRDYNYTQVRDFYIGSKYYKELSHQYLYVSMIGALDELKTTRTVPPVPLVRNLKLILETYTAPEAAHVFKDQARSRFTDARWAEFKADINGFLNCPWRPEDWQSLEIEAGYNPPPSSAVVTGSIASLIPINPKTISFLPFIDWSLTALTAGIVLRTFGFLGAAVFLLIYWTNDLSSLYWIGGTFCRNEWFFGLTLAICALDKKRYLLAGAAYGFAIAMRVFPIVFLFGACLPLVMDMCNDWRKNYQPVAKLLLGAILVLATLIIISLIQYPFSNWEDFYAKILIHNKILWFMHLGFDKVIALATNLGPQYFNNGIFWNENWNIFVNDRFNEHWMLYRSIALFFTAVSIFVCLRAQPIMASLLAGETIFYFFALPSNYYYIYLATFGVVTVAALKETPYQGNSLRFWCLIVFLIICNGVGGFSQDLLITNGWINLALFLFIFIYIASQLFQAPINRKEDKHRFFITFICIIFLAVMSFKPREFSSTNANGLKTQVLIFTTQDIESGKGFVQHLPNRSFYWHTEDHLSVDNPKGLVSVGKHFVIPQRGKYLVTVFYTSGTDNVEGQIKISGIDPVQAPLETWSPYPAYSFKSFVCEFPSGENSIHIFGTGDPARRFLGVNSVIVKPLDDFYVNFYHSSNFKNYQIYQMAGHQYGH